MIIHGPCLAVSGYFLPLMASTSACVAEQQQSRSAVPSSSRFLKEIILAVLEKFCSEDLMSGCSMPILGCCDRRIFA